MEQGVPIAASDVVGNRDVLKGWGVFFPLTTSSERSKLRFDWPRTDHSERN